MSHDFNDNKKAQGNGVGSAIGAALVGAAVGAAAAYLSNSDNRSKLKTKADETKYKAAQMFDSAAEKTGDALKDAGEKVKNSKKRGVSDSVDAPFNPVPDTTIF